MEKLNYIYDFETLGKNVNECVALSLSVIAFDMKRFASNPYTYEELMNETPKLELKFSVAEQVEIYGRKIEKDTLDWWSQQGASAKKILTPSEDDATLMDLKRDLLQFIKDNGPIDKTWTRGNSFDPVLMDSLYRDLSSENPLLWWTVRDTRTFIDALTIGTGVKNSFMPIEDASKVVLHNATCDCVLDILRMQAVYRNAYIDD